MRHELFDIRIDDLTKAELEARLVSFLRGGQTQCIATPNPEMLVDAIRDKNAGNPPVSPLGKGGGVFRSALQESNLNLPDGVALRFATSALTDRKLSNRHTGVDTLQRLIELCGREGKRVLLFGGDKKVAKEAINKLPSKVHIDFIDPGVVKIEDGEISIDGGIIDQITKIKPDIIAIALGHKKQLFFMQKFKDELPSVKIMIGIGGALDMISGRHKRAPKWMRKAGLEWVWRVLIEPRRIGRILKASIVFPAYVIVETIRSKRFVRAVRQTVPEIIKQLLSIN